MEARYCTGCGRALTDAEAQSGQPTCASCAASASESPSMPTEQGSLYGQPPTTGAERDVVGAGRYILNFLLAGFVGLALSYFLRFRGWLATWISLATGVVVIVALVVIAVVGVVQEERETEAFLEELNEITLDYQTEYTLPVTRASLLLETDCAAIEPDPTVSDCDAFMETLTDADVEMVRAIDRLKSLRQRIPESAPTEIDELIDGMIRILELDHRSNVLLAEGWNQTDSAKWQEGWGLALEAAVEGLDFAEDTLRIAQELEE